MWMMHLHVNHKSDYDDMMIRQLLHQRPDTETFSPEKSEENCLLFLTHAINCFIRLICLGRMRYYVIFCSLGGNGVFTRL